MTVGDPMFQYLRLLDAESDSSSDLPSLMLRPVSAEIYLEKLEISDSHPWINHPFFRSNSTSNKEPELEEQPVSRKTHQVSQDETIFSIGQMYNISEEQLMEWNNLGDTTIFIDQILFIEEPPIQETLPREEEAKMSKIVRFYTPVTKLTYNNNFPLGQNDGALWQGRGTNTIISAGGYVSYGPISASIRPNFIYSSNQDFTLSRWPSPDGISEYGYEFSLIDYPQRFADEPIKKIDPGQSWIRAEYNEFSIGLSTANMWLGPAIYNPVLLSNNAPGFPHFFIGTHEPYSTKIGSFEGKLFWGRLKESDYFDEDNSNDLRYLNGVVFTYSPSFAEGLHVGFSRMFVKPVTDSGLSFGDYFLALQRMKHDPSSDIDRLQMTSLFSRWKVPDYGFEFYMEWTRNSAPESFRDLLLEPEFSRVYTLGFVKRFTLAPEHWLTLNFEMTQLERPRSVEFRYSQPIYRSDAVIQGYTNEGQIMGAGIGPGSNSQKVHLSYYLPYGMFGVSFNRIVHDNTRLYENYRVIGVRPWGIRNPRIVNEVEFRYGVNAIVFALNRIELQVDLYRTKFFHHEHGVLDFENPNVYNTNLQFTLRYNFDNFLR